MRVFAGYGIAALVRHRLRHHHRTIAAWHPILAAATRIAASDSGGRLDTPRRFDVSVVGTLDDLHHVHRRPVSDSLNTIHGVENVDPASR